MRSYFQLFFGLLIPLSGLFIVIAIIYFTLDYDFTKALRLGVLAGFFTALALAFVLALLLLIMRGGKKPKKSILKKEKKPKDVSKSLKEEEKTKKAIKPKKQKIEIKEKQEATTQTTVTNTTKENTPTTHKKSEEKIMLLMDKELAYDIALFAIGDQNLGIVTENKDEENQITVKNNDELIKVTISSLTRHTAQVIVISSHDSNTAKKIITYMKEKEYSFLQY